MTIRRSQAGSGPESAIMKSGLITSVMNDQLQYYIIMLHSKVNKSVNVSALTGAQQTF